VSSPSLQPILALVGYPVGGNPVQYMVEKAFAHYGLDWRYVSLEVRPEDLADAVRGMKVMGFRGGNCAAPHKETIGLLLDELGRTAERTGVVNLIRRENDELVGENTEGLALVELLLGLGDLAGRQVALLGAGRMAKAVGVELAATKVAEIAVVGRTLTHVQRVAEMIAAEPGVAASAVEWQGDYVIPAGTDLVIHAAGVAGSGLGGPTPVNVESLDARMTVVETAVCPDTWLLERARERGCATVDGVEVFTNQVVLNFRTWTGVEPEAALLREAIEEFLEL
jgi:shikimate dehydrogenase